MKPRYFVQRRTKADDDDYFWREPVAEHIPVVSDHEATDTGLIDREGNAIPRAPNPMGFIW